MGLEGVRLSAPGQRPSRSALRWLQQLQLHVLATSGPVEDERVPIWLRWGYLPVPVPDPVAERGAVDWLHRQAESRGWPPMDGLAWAPGGTARASPPTKDPASFTPPFVPSFPTCLRHVCSGVPGRATGHTASQCPGGPSVVRKGRQRCQFKVNALGVKGTQEPPERAPCSQCWKGERSSQQNKVVLITTRSVK